MSSDRRPWSAVAQPTPTDARIGAGLCDPASLLGPVERAELDLDVTRMMDGRRDAEATADAIRLS